MPIAVTSPPPEDVGEREDHAAREKPSGRILAADDDPRNLRLLASLLGGSGYEVARAGSGEEALARVAEGGVDLLLLDVMMPGLSGLDVCERLRADPVTRMLPVVMVTALNAVEEKVRALEAGADDFLSKPVNRVELLARVRSLLRVKRLRDEIDAARRDLAAKNAALRDLESHKTTLTQMIVHDLRGPLAGILGYADLLRGKVRETLPALERSVSGIITASRHMQSMLADILDVSLLEENRLRLRLERTDLRSVAAMVVEEHRAQAAAAEIDLVLVGGRAPDPDGVVTILADAGMLHRVVGNLVVNALKHTPPGGRVLIDVGEPRGGGITVRVADTGEGIPAEARGRIFDKGVRADGQRMGTRMDRGLGLNFCKMAVEAHGGRIWVEPGETGGSTFAFVLPLRARAEAGTESCA